MAGFFNLWSKTAASNANSDSTINWAEGQLPSTVNGSARAEMAALASWRDDINGSLTTAGSSNAYTLTANIAFTALATGLTVCFKANHTNTGAATLAVNSLTAKALRSQNDTALEAGQIASGGKYFAVYDATFNSSAGAWVVLNPTIVSLAIKGHLDGLTTANNGTDADHDIDIDDGEAASDDSSPLLMRLSSALTKRIDASWAVGTGNGGLDGSESVDGTPDADTWYYIWLIMRSDTGVVDALYSESSTAPTMPTNYDHKRLIWAVRTDSSANIRPYTQVENQNTWNTPSSSAVINATVTTTVSTHSIATEVPPLLGVVAEFAANASNSGSAATIEVATALRADGTFSTMRANLSSEASTAFGYGQIIVPVDGSGQIKAKSGQASNTTLNASVKSFWFPR